MAFFRRPRNIEQAEHSCGMLGTLSMIYRHRNEAELSLAVLEMEEAVLEIYVAHVDAIPMSSDRIGAEMCRDTLIFKKNLIKNNLMMMLDKQLEWGPTIFRQLAGYEAKYGKTFDEQMYLFMLKIPEVNKEPTLRNVERLTDAECYAIVRKQMNAEELRAMDARDSAAILRVCAACDTKEGAIGDFKPCACKTVYYCGVECQTRHRNAHKTACKKALRARLRAAQKRAGRKTKGRR